MYDSTNSENTDRIYYEMVQCERHMRHVRDVFVSFHLYINFRSQYTNFAKATSINEFCTRFLAFGTESYSHFSLARSLALSRRSSVSDFIRIFLSSVSMVWFLNGYRVRCAFSLYLQQRSPFYANERKSAHRKRSFRWMSYRYVPSFKYFHSFHKVSSAKCSINKAPASASKREWDRAYSFRFFLNRQWANDWKRVNIWKVLINILSQIVNLYGKVSTISR